MISNSFLYGAFVALTVVVALALFAPILTPGLYWLFWGGVTIYLLWSRRVIEHRETSAQEMIGTRGRVIISVVVLKLATGAGVVALAVWQFWLFLGCCL